MSKRKILSLVLVFLTGAMAFISPQNVLSSSLSQNPPNHPAEAVYPTGNSGLAFNFIKEFGTFDTPYLVDSNHLNRPGGIWIDQATDDLYVTANYDSRLLKYDRNKHQTLAIGKPGISYTDDYVFSSPQDVALSADHHIWVADSTRIVEYDTNGLFIRNLPETDPWQSGTEDGRFRSASGIAFDLVGHLFVADQDAHRVQIFDWVSGSAPVYNTSIGIVDTPGNTLPNLNSPYRVEAKSDGSVYILEHGNGTILYCPYTSGSWNCSTVLSGLNDPKDLILGLDGNLYLLNSGEGQVIRCTGVTEDTCSIFSTEIWGSESLATDSQGKFYIARSYDCDILTIDATGQTVEPYLGENSVCYRTDEKHFNQPRVEIDPQNNMLVLEERGFRLLKFSPDGRLLWTFGAPGRDSSDINRLSYPHGLDTDANGNIYIADNQQVLILNSSGTVQSVITSSQDALNLPFGWVTDVAVDRSNGNIYVVDSPQNRVVIYNRSHQMIGQLGITNESGACGVNADNLHFCGPVGVETDTIGNIYVTDWGNNRVQKFTKQLQYQMTFGMKGQGTEQHGNLSGPDDLSIDSKGRVYIADMNNNRVEVFDSNGLYLATIGGGRDYEFRNLSDVSIDQQDNIYISDLSTSRIRKYQIGIPGWEQVNVTGFGDRDTSDAALEVFQGKIYAGTINWSTGPQIYRSSDGHSWEQVTTQGQGINVNQIAILDLISYNQFLYAATGWKDDAPGQIWRSADGVNWQSVVPDGFGDSTIHSVDAFIAYNGYLYASASGEADHVGVSIYRSATGDPGSWQAVITNGQGDSNKNVMADFAVFNGGLYGFGKDIEQGAFVWKASSNGTVWNQTNPPGFGENQIEAVSGSVFNGMLYVGTYNRKNNVALFPAQIWRTGDGVTWTKVINDGFQDANNGSVISLFPFMGELFAVTDNNVTGTEVWKSMDGATWKQISPDGFSSPTNTWSLRNHAHVIFNGQLYLGTSDHQTGVKIWRKTMGIYLPMIFK